jgi:hypothetical protein
VALVALLALASSCTGGEDRSSPRGAATPTVAAPVSPSPTSSPVTSERLVLVADLSESPAKWEKVFFAPFGRRPDQLGFKLFRESVNSQPSSFAVAGDGSFWIADRWKDRLVHYSVTGRFLGAINVPSPPPPMSISTARNRIRDVVFSGSGMHVLLDPTGGPIARVGADGKVQIARPQLQGRSLWVAEIFPSSGPLTILVGGYVNPEQGSVEDGPVGYFRWEPPRVPEQLRGLPGGNSSFARLERVSSASGADQDFELQNLVPDGTFVQPFHVDVRTGSRPGDRSLPAVVGPGNLIAAEDDVTMYVMLSPSRPRDATRYGGGRWLLRLGPSPVLWERLPDPGIPDEPQSRHLALGPDGSLYLMLAQKGGMLILRRP